MGRAAKKPLAPLASAWVALSLLRRWRAPSPLANPNPAGSSQHHGASEVTWSQNCFSWSIRASSAFPAIIAALIAPMDVPEIQGMDARLAQSLVDTGLIGPQCPATLQHQ